MSEALALVREAWDAADPWGSALDAQFAIADVLQASGWPVPPEWGYRPSPLLRVGQCPDGSWLAMAVWEALQGGGVTGDDLRAAGAVLGRHVARCAAAGRSY